MYVSIILHSAITEAVAEESLNIPAIILGLVVLALAIVLGIIIFHARWRKFEENESLASCFHERILCLGSFIAGYYYLEKITIAKEYLEGL